MSNDLNLIHTMGASRDNYDLIRPFVDKEYILIGDTRDYVNDIGEYFKLYTEDTKVDWDKFNTWSKLVRHPTWKRERHQLRDILIESLKSMASVAPDTKIIEHFVKLDYATRIHEICTQIAEGKARDLSEITPIIEDYTDRRAMSISGDGGGLFASTDLDELLANSIRGTGLEWRLEDLNIALGPLHQGDLVFVVARPEVGKTSFCASELTHMVAQLRSGGRGVLFNNEERGRLFLRLLSAGTGLSLLEISGDSTSAKIEYEKSVGDVGRIAVVEPASPLSTHDIERVLKSHDYGLICINVLDKVSGFGKAESDVERLRQLGMWARRIANKHAPVICVLQADASAEGVDYLNQSQIYGSKTGLQGEADAIIMIGKKHGIEDRRYISIVKNKLPGGPRSVPALRHGQFEVGFNETTGRYFSLRYKSPTT